MCNNATSTWTSLTDEAHDGTITSCVLQANLHHFVHAGSQTPLYSDDGDDNMFAMHHGTYKVVTTP
jgi:hypothetical protein